ncbi:MAG: hypothetical protein ACI971_000602 [Colwellia sp.]|jgi:hypothetical protein
MCDPCGDLSKNREPTKRKEKPPESTITRARSQQL